MLLGLLHIISYVERENNFFLSYPPITDTKSSPRGCPQKRESTHRHQNFYISCKLWYSESSSVGHLKKPFWNVSVALWNKYI